MTIALHASAWAMIFLLPFQIISPASPMMSVRASAVESDALHFLPPPPDMMVATEGMAGAVHGFSVAIDPVSIQMESLVTNSFLAAFFYLNMFVLVPGILSKKGWPQYVAIIFISLGLFLSVGYLFRLQYLDFGLPFGPPFLIGIPNFLMVFGLSLALRLMQDRTAYEKALKEQENEKLKAELSFLRSQVSPHFVFNVLNSVASLARKKSDQVESAIIQLSQLMRYTLYQSDKKVTLEHEAEYISNYIQLQKLRFGATVNMHFRVNLERKDLLIEPMLLVAFIENSFKHGVGLISDPVIMIILESTNSRINFMVRNKFNPDDNEVKDPVSGIGLQNVRRRLDLLYRHCYELDTYTRDNWFIAELKIILA
ncbi:MAG: sensor histidine kinase [Bacteroidota bacterium]